MLSIEQRRNEQLSKENMELREQKKEWDEMKKYQLKPNFHACVFL